MSKPYVVGKTVVGQIMPVTTKVANLSIPSVERFQEIYFWSDGLITWKEDR